MSTRLVRGVLRRYSERHKDLGKNEIKPPVVVYTDGNIFRGVIVDLLESENTLELEVAPGMSHVRVLVELDKIQAIQTNWTD